MPRWVLLALLLVLLVPAARAAAETRVTFAHAADRSVWTVQERANGSLLWIPRGALDVGVFVDNGSRREPATWRFESADLARVDAGGGDASVVFVLPTPSPFQSLEVRAPGPVTVRIEPAPGDPAPSGDDLAADGGAWTGRSASGALELRLVPLPPGATGLELTAAVVLLATITYVAGRAWSKRRIASLLPSESSGWRAHLAELQARLFVVVAPFALANLVYFAVGLEDRAVGRWRLPVPGAGPSMSAQVFEALASHFLPHGVSLVVTRPAEAIMAQLEVTIFLAIVTVLPLLVMEVMGFLAPAMTARERRFVRLGLPVFAGLFVLGCLFAAGILIPLILRSLYEYTADLSALAYVSVEELVSFVVAITLAIGIAFELPLAMGLLASMRLVPPSFFVKHWRVAVLVIFVAATILNPDPSITSQLVVALPVFTLYFVGVGVAYWVARPTETTVPSETAEAA